MKIISVDDFKAIIHKPMNIFDVRDANSYKEGHIDDAVHLSNDNFQKICAVSDKTLPTVVYCFKGFSSQPVANMLQEQGFEKVYSLEGGYQAWSETE